MSHKQYCSCFFNRDLHMMRFPCHQLPPPKKEGFYYEKVSTKGILLPLTPFVPVPVFELTKLCPFMVMINQISTFRLTVGYFSTSFPLERRLFPKTGDFLFLLDSFAHQIFSWPSVWQDLWIESESSNIAGSSFGHKIILHESGKVLNIQTETSIGYNFLGKPHNDINITTT